MNAAQDEWVGPLAKEMIDQYRTRALAYVKVMPGGYDENTGTILSSEIAYQAAGAVVKSEKVEREGVFQSHEIEAWIDHETVPWPISAADYVVYLGLRWKVVHAESYGSGGDGSPVGPIYLATIGGQLITGLDGEPLRVGEAQLASSGFTMYASMIKGRAE